MVHSIKFFLVYLFVMLMFQGCMMEIGFTAQGIDVPVSMTSHAGRAYTVLRHFTIEQDRSSLFIKRLWGGGLPDITSMLAKELKKTPGDAIINLSIEGNIHATDAALPVIIGIGGVFIFPPLILFIFEPLFTDLKSFTAEGDIIVFTEDNQNRKKSPPIIDPMTGLPIKEDIKIEFDPDTGLPKK